MGQAVSEVGLNDDVGDTEGVYANVTSRLFQGGLAVSIGVYYVYFDVHGTGRCGSVRCSSVLKEVCKTDCTNMKQ